MADLISGAIGAVLGASGTYLVARFNRRGQLIDARRKAYASWFAKVALMGDRITRLCTTPVGFPNDEEGEKAFTAEIEALSEDNQALLTASTRFFSKNPTLS
jgi:hypothetical protein